MVFSIKESGHSQQIEYVKALFSEDCNLEATAALNYREINNVSIEKNVSTVTLEFNTGELISISAQSSGGNTVLGHSERVALAQAINKAITDGMDLVSGCQLISNIRLPPIEELNSFKSILQSLKKIKIYTERMPCTRNGRDGSEQCDIFFAKLFENVNYEFYYSIPLGVKTGIEINNELDKQVSEANIVYKQYLQHNETLENIEQQIKNIDDKLKEESKNNPATLEDGNETPNFVPNKTQTSLMQEKIKLNPIKIELISKLKKIKEQYGTQPPIIDNTATASRSLQARFANVTTVFNAIPVQLESQVSVNPLISQKSKESPSLPLGIEPPKSKPKPSPKH